MQLLHVYTQLLHVYMQLLHASLKRACCVRSIIQRMRENNLKIKTVETGRRIKGDCKEANLY